MELLLDLFRPDHEKSTRSPFAGGPETAESTLEDGTKQITVMPSAIMPLRAKLADWLSLLTFFTAVGYAIFLANQIYPASQEESIALIALPFAAYVLAKLVFYRAFQKSVRVVYMPDRLVVHKMFGPKSFDRSMPHSFALYTHEKKERENEILSYREKKRAHWWISRSAKRYCGKSYYISFEYMGQRNDIMLVYKRKKAQEIIARLKACDEVMDGYRGNGRGHSLTPQDEWTAQAGGLDAAQGANR